ncbi:efflux RND transporter periplasmic adaptor subunit [Aquimarina aquimarini]|uniref:efflux RND transporter periplasmic adaptor subunit n=1 Tax=Aquimarina aquimarini TaxID=1191734 RepID=UPI000D54FDBE|nr:efflux RND transporter periplasmic adaptor subunit [Aquimarina aquimarini]
MNKNIIYIIIAVVVGFIVGYLVFGNEKEQQDKINQQDKEHQAKEMWTCSMHPQIKKTEPGDCPICGMDLILAEIGEGALAENQFKMTANAIALANIQTTIIGNHTTDKNRTTLSGKIIENEEENGVQASYFDGRIERLIINYKGQKIKKGQKLATIYSPDLIAAQQELITASSLKKSQPSLYKAVRNKLKLWKLSDKQINTIEISGKAQENFTIYATVSGTVSELISAEGDYVKQGQPILKVSNLKTVWAEFDVYENQISQFKKGQNVIVKTKAYPDKNFKATISFINPVLNNKTRTVSIRVTLVNHDNILKPGMFVTGEVKGTTITGAKQLMIPSSAILWTGKRSIIYRKVNAETPIFEMREVTLGNNVDNQYVILEGLNDGDEIVTNGTFTVDAAAQLQGKKSMMNQKTDRISNTDKERETSLKLSKAFQKDFLPAITEYLYMKEAFITSDATQVIVYATKMVNILEAIKSIDIGNAGKKHLSKSIEILNSISKKDNIDNQRTQFISLNEEIIKLISNFDTVDMTIYIQQCPMANRNKGAVWISSEKEIRNPYFGDKMLTCGSIIDTIN